MILKTLIFAPDGRDEMKLDLTGELHSCTLLFTVPGCTAFQVAVFQKCYLEVKV